MCQWQLANYNCIIASTFSLLWWNLLQLGTFTAKSVLSWGNFVELVILLIHGMGFLIENPIVNFNGSETSSIWLFLVTKSLQLPLLLWIRHQHYHQQFHLPYSLSSSEITAEVTSISFISPSIWGEGEWYSMSGWLKTSVSIVLCKHARIEEQGGAYFFLKLWKYKFEF